MTNIKGGPDGLGRIKVKFPWLSDSLESDWARIVYPGAGKERGFMFTPEVDDEVIVCFEHGDFRRPYVLGGLFNGVDKPKDIEVVDKNSGKVCVRAFTTPGRSPLEVHRQGRIQRQRDQARNRWLAAGVDRARRSRSQGHDQLVRRRHDRSRKAPGR